MSIAAYLLRVMMWISRFFLRISGHHIHRLRKNYLRSAILFKFPKEIEEQELVINTHLKALSFTPPKSSGGAILFFHGGGYCIGSPQTHRSLTAKFSSDTGHYTLSPDYRLAPEHPFPAAVQDALAAYEYLLSSGYAPSQISVGGDSAGGGLTMALLLTLKEKGMPLPASAFLISPWLDLSFSGPSIFFNEKKEDLLLLAETMKWAHYYAGEHKRTDPIISPLFGDLAGMPPILLQVGDREAILSDSTRLHERLQQQKSSSVLQIYPGMFHDWQMFWNYMPEAKKAVEDISQFISEKHKAAHL